MKVLKLTGLGLVVIVAAASLALAFGIPAGFLIEPIQNRVETETGYRLRIAGDVTIGMWPSPTMTLRDIALIDTTESSPQVRLMANRVRVAISLPSLFGNRPRLTEVAVFRPTFRAPVTRERTVPAERAAERSAERRRTPAPAVTIDRVLVQEGTLLLLSRGNRTESRVDNIEIDGSLRADTFEAKASGHADGEPLRLQVKGKAPAGLLEGAPVALEFVFEAPGLFQGPLPGSAELKANGSLLHVNTLTGTIGPNKFNGWASIDFKDKPLVRLDLDFQRVELGARPAAGASSNIDAPSALDRPWSDQRINLDGLNFFDAEAQISATELSAGTFRFAPISLKATLADGLLSAGFAQVGIYGGQASGAMVIDARGEQPSHALRLELSGVRALPLLADTAGFSAIDGRMQAKIDVRSRGASQRAVMSSLDGTLEILVSDGEIRNVNIAQMIRSLTSSTLNGWQQSRADKTDLSQLSATFNLEKGRATTDNLRLMGPLVRVSGAGTVDLGAKTLQFRLDPRLVMSLEGQRAAAADPLGFGVPVLMEGPWSQPRINLDMAGILENPDSAYAKLREMGTGLFGGGTGNSLMQGIGSFMDRLAKDPKEAPPPATGGRLPPPQSPQPQAQPQQRLTPPQSQAQPQPLPPPQSQGQAQPLPPPQSQSQGQPLPPPQSPTQTQSQQQPRTPPQSRPQDVEGQIRDILRDLLR